MNSPEGFKYPLISAGFILSKSLVEVIREVDSQERWSGFAIDAKYEVILSCSYLESNDFLFPVCSSHS